ncbi:TPA: hypothetical protein I9089_002316 [Clostridium perfringens]|nr:hypothetical protein [Clostridium perfringens]
MSTGFNWFTKYEFIKKEYRIGEIEYNVEYLDGGDTSFSSYNIGKVDDLLEMYGDLWIPRVWDEYGEDPKVIEDLIEPKIMSDVCEKILKDTKVDEVGMRDRIEWMKKLADEGYYMTYDYD